MVSSDRRTDLRGAREERLFVKVIACPENADLEGTTIGCTTQDVSSSGIQLSVSQVIPSATTLELWVEVKGLPGKFMLSGDVRWCREDGDKYSCGIELRDGEGPSDLADWQDLFI